MAQTQPSPPERPAALPAAPDEGKAAAIAAFRRGVLDALPFLLVVTPFALLFGVVASDAGLTLAQTLGFSLLVLAGASQFTAVQLLAEQVPTALVIASALAVNLRMAMYSASLVPWLGSAPAGARAWAAYLLIDQTYALGIQRFESAPALTVRERLSYFNGTALVVCLPWVVLTGVGARAGNAIPDTIPLDFAIPVTFLAMTAPMLRTRAHVAAAVVGVGTALALAGLPNGTGLLIAGPLGMIAGALVEGRGAEA